MSSSVELDMTPFLPEPQHQNKRATGSRLRPGHYRRPPVQIAAKEEASSLVARLTDKSFEEQEALMKESGVASSPREVYQPPLPLLKALKTRGGIRRPVDPAPEQVDSSVAPSYAHKDYQRDEYVIGRQEGDDFEHSVRNTADSYSPEHVSFNLIKLTLIS